MARLVLIDTGTTNTRVWLTADGQVVRRLYEPVGVRDSAHDRSSARLHATVRRLVEQASSDQHVDGIVAGGMAGSPLGLVGVGHVHAPASIDTIAAGCQVVVLPSVSALPVTVIPGVRTLGPTSSEAVASMRGTLSGDVMRGEETLAAGLIAQQVLGRGAILLTLGSHWKSIAIDEHGRIAWSRTSLSGELLDAVRSHTVLASSLGEAPEAIDPGWTDAGAAAVHDHGLARALFGVRLLEQDGTADGTGRFSYLLAALVEDARRALLPDDICSRATGVVISGRPLVSQVWQQLTLPRLAGSAAPPVTLTGDETEQAWIAGALAISERFGHTITRR